MTCQRYEAKHNAENKRIAEWLVRLADKERRILKRMGIEIVAADSDCLIDTGRLIPA